MPPKITNLCPACGKQNRDNASFCAFCGEGLKKSSIPKFCPFCGSKNSGNKESCSTCGKRFRYSGEDLSDYIFISYSRKDQTFANQLADDLKVRGYSVWFDQEIYGGDDWRAVIEDKLQNAREIIVILSNNSMQSKWVNHECSIAYGLNKKIIPITIESGLSQPVWAEDKQTIPCYSKSAYQRTLSSLSKSLYPPPEEIESRLSDIRRRLLLRKDTYELTRLNVAIESILKKYPEKDQPTHALMLHGQIKDQMRKPVLAQSLTPAPSAKPPARQKGTFPKWAWAAAAFACVVIGMAPVLMGKGILASFSSNSSSTSIAVILPTGTAQPMATGTPTPTITAKIVIIEIFYAGQNGSGEPDEYVEIRNDDSTGVQLREWSLRDEGDHVFIFPTYVMEPGQVCRVYTNEDHPEWCGFNFGSSTSIWGNEGDCAHLRDAEDNEIDVYCY